MFDWLRRLEDRLERTLPDPEDAVKGLLNQAEGYFAAGKYFGGHLTLERARRMYDHCLGTPETDKRFEALYQH